VADERGRATTMLEPEARACGFYVFADALQAAKEPWEIVEVLLRR